MPQYDPYLSCRAKTDFAQILMKLTQTFHIGYMTCFTPDALVSSLGIDFSRRIFFFAFGEHS